MAGNIIKQLSHHAYCLIGTSLLLQELITELEEQHGIPAQANPDFHKKYYANFVIDDARELISFSEMRPVHSSGKKIIVVQLDNITGEAQNALLKLLEEPADYAHFFLIIPSRHLLLPTMQSRLSFVDVDAGVGEHDQNDILKNDGFSVTFLKSTFAKRLEMVKKIVDDISDEKTSKRFAIDFLDSLERTIVKEKGVKAGATSLEAIQYARSYMNDRAPSLKMLLEYVALSV